MRTVSGTTMARAPLRGAGQAHGMAVSLDVSAYRVPTDRPESDGTFSWDATTLVVVHATAQDVTGLGWTYAPAAAGELVRELLEPALDDPFDVPAAWAAMVAAVRNAGPWGLAMYAVAAVDVALWDLKARLLDTSLLTLLGRRRATVPIYGSGGFCSYSDEQLTEQLGGWADAGLPRVKMKVGRRPADDVRRVAVARAAIGGDVELMVDANGAYDTATAVRLGHAFAEQGVRWFEEPVSSDDRAGLRFVRTRLPAGVAVAAGEYATDVFGFRALLEAGAVDVLQADVTRCGGITGFLRADALAAAYGVPLSAHCAPALAAYPMAAAQRAEHIEWFHDHVRIETLLFDGVSSPEEGALRPDPSRPGHGLTLKHADAAAYRV
jgi:L-alanine-DL-glutamate epimerase-like enolase superfamily enzyme